MVVYHPAFDLYHSVYRILQLLTFSDRKEYVELDRLRIWDFYLLFPEKIHTICLKKEEIDIRKLFNTYISKKENPYETVLDNRKMFEKIKPYQITAIKCLASYGIIKKEFLVENRVTIISKEILKEYISKFEPLTPTEMNLISILTSHFHQVSMYGSMGLKERTKLLESKYDA